jgi:hypothetical protein
MLRKHVLCRYEAISVKKQVLRRIRQISSRFSAERQLIIVASAHKVGSTWLCSLISDLCDCPGYKLSSKIRQANRGILPVDIDLDIIIASAEVPRRTYVLKSHSYPPNSPLPAWAKLITMTRDPRDVIVSSAFYLANLAEDSGGWGEKFAALSVKERIAEIIRNGEFLRSRLHAWNDVQEAHHVRYESLLEDPATELKKIQMLTNNRKSADQVAKIIDERSFANESGRARGTEDKASFLRKGVRGDWRNYFDDELKIIFKSSINGDWGELVLELGYESDNSW